MATRQPVILPVVGENNIDGFQVVWSGLLNGDVGAPVGSTIGQTGAVVVASGGGLAAGFADKCVAPFTGTPGAGCAVTIEGSLDGVNFYQVHDPFSNIVTLITSTLTLTSITEAVIQIRPHVTGGDGTTNLNVTMFFRRTNQ